MKCEMCYGTLLSQFRNELDETNTHKIPTEVAAAKARVALMEMLIRDDEQEINEIAFPDQSQSRPSVKFQWRELGEDDWEDCDYDLYRCLSHSSSHETRTVDEGELPS